MPENPKYKPTRRRYRQTTITHKTTYLGVIICPKCNKKGYAQITKFQNKTTKTIYTQSLTIQHQIKKWRIEKKQFNKRTYCTIYNYKGDLTKNE